MARGAHGNRVPGAAHRGLRRRRNDPVRSTRRRRRTSPSPDPGPYSKTPVARLPEAHRPRIERRYLGTAREGDAAENMRLRTARSTVQDTADAQGDVDAFIDRVEEDTRKDPAVAAAIARRLLAAGRAVEALETAEAAEVDDGIHLSRRRLACDDARIDALDALGRRNGAQRQRWTCFERALAARYPLAATLALRAVIDHAIGQGHTIRDKDMERHLPDRSGRPRPFRTSATSRPTTPSSAAKASASSCSATASPDGRDRRMGVEVPLPYGAPSAAPGRRRSQKAWRSDSLMPWPASLARVGARSTDSGSRLPSRQTTRPGPRGVRASPRSV